MIKFNAEGLREELRSALLVLPRTKGQLDGTEVYVNSDERFKRSKQRIIVGENGEELARVKAPVVTTLACKQFKRSPMPLPDSAFDDAALVRDMNSASEHISDWLRFCYSDGAQCPTKVLLSILLARFYTHESKKVSEESKELIKKLALLATLQKRDALNARSNQLKQVEIAKLSKRSTKAWEKTWSKRWKRLLNILDTFDREGLEHVYERGSSRKAAKKHGDMFMQSTFQAAS